MKILCIAAGAAFLVAGCTEDAAPQQQTEQRAALTPGAYELSWTVAELRSTDKTTPATGLSKAGTGTTRACVGGGGEIDPALFAEADDECTATNSYIRSGRISMQLECKRPGESGQVLLTVDGTSTADSLKGDVSTSTYLAGPGDYAMSRTFTGRRLGECPPAAPQMEGSAAD